MRKGSLLEYRVTLRDIEPPVWRQVVVPAAARLDQLHHILRAAFGWETRHLYRFLVDGVEYAGDEPDDDVGQVVHSAVLLRCYEAMPRVGAALTYEYDFGDGWIHDVVLQRVHQSIDKFWLVPYCMDGARSGPPEDSSGPGGYTRLLDVLRDPAHAEHTEMLAWVGPGFDAESFSPRVVNGAFCRMINTGVLGEWPPPVAGAAAGREIDVGRVDEMALALLYLTLHDVGPSGGRAWKGLDWQVLDRLYEKGFIGNPVGRSKSVAMTPAGLAEAERLFVRHFGGRA